MRAFDIVLIHNFGIVSTKNPAKWCLFVCFGAHKAKFALRKVP